MLYSMVDSEGPDFKGSITLWANAEEGGGEKGGGRGREYGVERGGWGEEEGRERVRTGGQCEMEEERGKEQERGE